MDTKFEGVIDAGKLWTGEADRDAHLRSADFLIESRLNRHDFGVSWNDELPGGGLVVSNWIDLDIDVEAILDEDLRTVGLAEAVYAGG